LAVNARFTKVSQLYERARAGPNIVVWKWEKRILFKDLGNSEVKARQEISGKDVVGFFAQL
jgi:hypothetical protein